MKVLFLGEEALPGSSRYLLAILKIMHARVKYVSSKQRITQSLLRQRYDVILLSDFPRSQASLKAQTMIADASISGSGLMMIGGWASFSGPFGKWRGSAVEDHLPVECLNKDDRLNFPSGALVLKRRSHEILKGVTFHNSPAICGLNRVLPKKGSQVILSARRIVPKNKSNKKYEVNLEAKDYPLLVTQQEGEQRSAVFASDVAPHWCGGLVDWGTKRFKVSLRVGTEVEISNLYVKLFSQTIRWLGNAL